ncbi:unnamed protein product, partial [Tetraodon nigroviridis]
PLVSGSPPDSERRSCELGPGDFCFVSGTSPVLGDVSSRERGRRAGLLTQNASREPAGTRAEMKATGCWCVCCRFMNKPASANRRYQPTCHEHAANCYTHAGEAPPPGPRRQPGSSNLRSGGPPQLLVVPAALGVLLLQRLSHTGWERLTACVYGLGLCALFLVSTVFHFITWKMSHLRSLEQCFHMCDRVVIYFFIAASYTPWYKLVELVFYLTMGFFPASAVMFMNNTEGLWELLYGGCIYCTGIIFFKSDGVIPFAHAIWHVFVALAAAVHYYAIWKYLYT